NSNIATLAGGDTSNSVLTFVPKGQGNSTLSVDVGSITCAPACSPAFSTPTTGGQIVATVSQPAISLNMANQVIGANLEVSASGALNVNAPNTMTIKISSSDGNVVLSNANNTAGSSSITITIQPNNGLNGSGFPTFFVQALAAAPTSGSSVTLTAHDQANQFADGTIQVTLAPSGLVLASQNGIGQDFSTSLGQIGGGDKPLTVEAFQLDPVTLAPVAEEAVKGGLTLAFTIQQGTNGVATIVGTQAISPGSLTQSLTFHPVATGSTTLTVPAPPGFVLPASGNALNATVNP
ncbi:MAG TPA: hypothetical protein VEG30_00095, partial [Terriglobales bacterium]|nr:hypothetical protein [Terriglobales bacterium]